MYFAKIVSVFKVLLTICTYKVKIKKNISLGVDGLVFKILNNRIKRRNGKNKGFSLVELIIVITITIILLAVFTPELLRYIENAKKGTAFTNASILFNTAQIALATAQSEYPSEFKYAAKYNVPLSDSDEDQAKIKEKYGTDTIRVGRFTNKSLYQYVNNKTSNNKSAKADFCIAQVIVETLSSDDYLVDCNPIDDRDNTKDISNNKEKYGKFAFAFTYNENGEIVYFQATYNGYFFKVVAGETSIEKVDDSLYFADWPTYGQRIDSSW